MSGEMSPLARKTISTLFARRHESELMRSLWRKSIEDYRLWVRLFGGAGGERR